MSSPIEKKLRKTGFTGIALGVLALLACELPIILALVGLSALSASATAFKPPYWVEMAGITVAITGLLLLVIVTIRVFRKRSAE